MLRRSQLKHMQREAHVAGATKSAGESSIGETFSADVFSSRCADASKPLNDLYNAEKEATSSTNLEGDELIRCFKSDIKLTFFNGGSDLHRAIKSVPRGRGPVYTEQVSGFW